MGESKRRVAAGVDTVNTHDREAWRRRCRQLSALARESITLVSGPNSTVRHADAHTGKQYNQPVIP